MNDHSHTRDDAHHHHAFDSPDMASYAEFEGEVLLDLVTQAVDVVGEFSDAHGVAVSRIHDIGSGPGVATCALAQRFDPAFVLAVDGSAAMLERARVRAVRLGVGLQVETRQVELPAGLGTLGRADVVWASQVLHHLQAPIETLARMHELLEPGGLLAVVEPAGPMRVIGGDADPVRPDSWERLDTAWTEWFTDTFTHRQGVISSANRPTMLRDAGFELVTDQMLSLTLTAPLNSQARRYAHDYIRGIRTLLTPYADAGELEALDVLTDENSDQSVIRRDDARIWASRNLYIARAE